MDAAQQADADFDRGIDKGPLQGIPLGVKDIIATRDAPTTANSHILDRNWGAPGTRRSSNGCASAGSVLMGKTVTSEFALRRAGPGQRLPDAEEPLEPRALRGGIQRRLGHRRRRGPGARRARHRHRRLGARPGVRQRAHRA